MPSSSKRSPHVSGVVVIGAGNLYRSDDGAGIAIVRALSGRVPSHVRVLERDGEAASMIEAWRACDLAVIVDAVRGPEEAGHIYRFDVLEEALPVELFQYSTHTFGIGPAVELARVLDRLPNRLIVYGIEGRDFTTGTALSPEVKSAVTQAANRILDEIH